MAGAERSGCGEGDGPAEARSAGKSDGGEPFRAHDGPGLHRELLPEADGEGPGSAADAAAESGVDLTTATNAHCLFEEAVDEGYGEKDMSAVVELIRGAARK